MYERMLSTAPGKRFFLDKTPAYALVLPFLVKLYPDAKYIVLTRHPLAVLSSWVESFFDGDYQVALNHNPLLARHLPALARILREAPMRYALERKVLVALRRNIHHNTLGRVLKRVRFALDVVLRE